jgi:hypothetical protein
MKVSPYLKFSIAWCARKGLFTINPISKKREYDGGDLVEGMLAKREWELRNRQGK